MKEGNRLMGVLCYLGPFIAVSYLVARDEPFVKFHIKQGLVLFIIEAAVWIIRMYLWQFWAVYQLINFAVIILSIVGIINVANGHEKELPFIGHYGHKFKI